MKSNFALKIYIEIAAQWIKELSKSVKVLSRICWRQKFLDGSRFYQKSIVQIEIFSMDQEAIEKLSRQSPESSMDWICDKICREKKSKGLDRRESVKDLSRSCRALKKRVFHREEKHKEMNATKQATQHISKQHVKLLKTSLNKNNAKHS